MVWSLSSLSLFFFLFTQQSIIKECQIKICDYLFLLLLVNWSILPEYKSADEQLMLEMHGDPIAVGKLL